MKFKVHNNIEQNLTSFNFFCISRTGQFLHRTEKHWTRPSTRKSLVKPQHRGLIPNMPKMQNMTSVLKRFSNVRVTKMNISIIIILSPL